MWLSDTYDNEELEQTNYEELEGTINLDNIGKNLSVYKKYLIETLKKIDEDLRKIKEYEQNYTKFSRGFYEVKLMYLKERREILEKLSKIDMDYYKQVQESLSDTEIKDITDLLKK